MTKLAHVDLAFQRRTRRIILWKISVPAAVLLHVDSHVRGEKTSNE
jgi:hypothetical protein